MKKNEFSQPQNPLAHPLLLEEKRVGLNWLLTVAILCVALLICEFLYQLDTGQQNSVVLVTLAVFIIAAITDGYMYGITAACIGVFVYDFLITTPRLNFSFTVGFPVTLCIMLAVTLVTTTITTQIKTKAKISAEKERRADLLYEINRKLLSTRDLAAIASYSNGYLSDWLNRSVVFYPTDPSPTPDNYYFRQVSGSHSANFFNAEDTLVAVRQVFTTKEPAGRGTPHLPDVSAYYHPIILQEELLGVFGISCKDTPLSDSEMAFVEMLSMQAAQALHVYQLAQSQQQMQVEAETEQARNSFLRAISHDLRTPLTSIMGASSVLLDNRDALDDTTSITLTQGIHKDAEWLLHMVENILSVTRIHGSGMKVSKTMEAAEEVIAETVSAIRKKFSNCTIQVEVPDELLLVPMDGILISQVLNNFLENALYHAGKKDGLVVHIDAAKKGQSVTFTVSDNGNGINAETMEHLFEVLPSSGSHSEDSSRGMGMGLSICKTIIEAHGGTITGINLPEKGAQFSFTLPLEPLKEDIS